MGKVFQNLSKNNLQSLGALTCACKMSQSVLSSHDKQQIKSAWSQTDELNIRCSVWTWLTIQALYIQCKGFTTKCKILAFLCFKCIPDSIPSCGSPWWGLTEKFISAHLPVWHVALIRKQDQPPSNAELYTLRWPHSQFHPDLAAFRRRSQSSKCTLAQIWSVYTQTLAYHYSWKNMGTAADQ